MVSGIFKWEFEVRSAHEYKLIVFVKKSVIEFPECEKCGEYERIEDVGLLIDLL